MCYESSKCKFDLWYQKMYNMNLTYKEWLEREREKKRVLCYDGGHWYDNMTTNLSE